MWGDKLSTEGEFLESKGETWNVENNEWKEVNSDIITIISVPVQETAEEILKIIEAS